MHMPLDAYLWGKMNPYKSLRGHMIDAGACARAYLSCASQAGMRTRLAATLNCSECDAVALIAYLTALHDIGKIHPYFVSSSPERFAIIPDEIRKKHFPRTEGLRYRHERGSADAALRIWKEGGIFDRGTRATLCAVLALHHQGKREDAGIGKLTAAWNAMQDRLEAQMRALFCPEIPNVRIAHHDALGAYLVGLVVLCDWVASSKEFDDTPASAGDTDYLQAAIERAERTLHAFGLTGKTPFPQVCSFTVLFPEIPASGMRPLQVACARIANTDASLTIIEAPMGEGKSEAALYIAARLCANLQLQGIYMALPTAATSNQMHKRVQAMFEKIDVARSVRLLHSLAWLVEADAPGASDFHLNAELDGDAQSATEWLAPLRRGLLSENAVGTVDQAMAAVLYRKYGLLRLTGLAGKVLIIDEIHAYDVYMSEIIERLLDWCNVLKIPVILLSATMRSAQKEHYLACYGVHAGTSTAAYPLITQVDARGALMETPVDGVYMKSRFLFRTIAEMNDVEKIAQRAIDRVADGGRLCVMLNTVRKAQKVYQAIKKRGSGEVMLFHARFLNERRAQIEEDCIRRFGKDAGEARIDRMILVCTQVVEQSLDVDFDGMITELAPIDLLLQRAGRVHRHRERARPDKFAAPLIEVLVPDDSQQPLDNRYGGSGYVYDPYILACTEDLLADVSEIRVPEDVRACVEKVYAGLSTDRMEAFIRRLTKEEIEKNAAEAVLFPPPNARRFFGASPLITDRFERPDEDFGFRILRNAPTRYSVDSLRVAFLARDLFDIARNESLSRADEVRISKKICSLSLTTLKNHAILSKDEEYGSEIILIRSGHLKGCIAVWTEDEVAQVGDMRLRVNDELGVWTEEESHVFGDA